MPIQKTAGIEECLTKRHSRIKDQNQYVNCNFILGSVAEVEGIWSVAGYVQSDHRRSMTPPTVRKNPVLRYKERIWSPQLVAEAVSRALAAIAALEDQEEELYYCTTYLDWRKYFSYV